MPPKGNGKAKPPCTRASYSLYCPICEKVCPESKFDFNTVYGYNFQCQDCDEIEGKVCTECKKVCVKSKFDYDDFLGRCDECDDCRERKKKCCLNCKKMTPLNKYDRHPNGYYKHCKACRELGVITCKCCQGNFPTADYDVHTNIEKEEKKSIENYERFDTKIPCLRVDKILLRKTGVEKYTSCPSSDCIRLKKTGLKIYKFRKYIEYYDECKKCRNVTFYCYRCQKSQNRNYFNEKKNGKPYVLCKDCDLNRRRQFA